MESEVGKGSSFHCTVPFSLQTDITEMIGDPHPKISPPPLLNRMEQEHYKVESKNILLVEDDPINQKVAVNVLQKLKHNVTVAQNGRQAVELVQFIAFDIVLMDVQMPVMDGLTATRHIREKEKRYVRHVPIIAMTAHAFKGDKEKCLEAGMNGYITKPINSQKVLETISRWSDKAMASPSPGKGSGQQDFSGSYQLAAAPIQLSDVLDWAMGDPQFLKEMLEEFCSLLHRELGSIKSAIQKNDMDQLTAAAHQIKGAAVHLNVKRIVDAAFHLEQLGHREDLSGVKPILQELQIEANHVIDFIKKIDWPALA